jgi:hypothetical protein
MWRFEGIETRDLDQIMAFWCGLAGGARETCFLHMTERLGLLQKYSVRLTGLIAQEHVAFSLCKLVRP